jgi:hypothetical protein
MHFPGATEVTPQSTTGGASALPGASLPSIDSLNNAVVQQHQQTQNAEVKQEEPRQQQQAHQYINGGIPGLS